MAVDVRRPATAPASPATPGWSAGNTGPVPRNRPGIAGAPGLLRRVGAQAKLERCADWLHLVDVPVADIEKILLPKVRRGR